MTLPLSYHPAALLEQQLGDPLHALAPLSFQSALRGDEAELFPSEAVAHLHALGLPAQFVPASLGGAFTSSEGFVALGRVLARRDMTVAVTYCTLLWSVLAWIGGDGRQRERIAQAILAGEFPCLAYSEASHGADLVANVLRAERQADGRYRVTGEKWPINRATQSQWVVLLARTDSTASMRNQSLFIVNRAELDPASLRNLPAVSTHGLRGCDISGIAFDNCLLPADSLVGAPGQGLELALKGFQVTRTFCVALSLGVNDTALRIVARFAHERQLYGQSVLSLPHARDRLANGYLSLWMAECVAVVAARGLHLFTEQFATWSSVAKVQVSCLCDQATAQIAPVLGARQYMRDANLNDVAMFQKCVRDGGIVSIFDGANIVCLDALVTFLPDLAKGSQQALAPQSVHALYDLSVALPALNHQGLRLTCRGQDAVMQSLPTLLDAAQAVPGLVKPTARLSASWLRLQQDIAALSKQREPSRNSARGFGLAERYLAIHTQVVCLGLWLHNREALGGFFARGDWLLAALQREGSPAFETGALPPSWADALCEQLLHQTLHAEMFSFLPWPLAGHAAPGRFVTAT